MKRSSFRRRKISRADRKQNSYAKRLRHFDYMGWVKTLPCAALIIPGHRCSGPIEADHAHWEHGKGEKCHDSLCIPLCSLAHQQKTDYPGPSSGAFRDMTHEQFTSWLLDRIVQTQNYARGHGVKVPEAPPTKVPWRRDRITTAGPAPLAGELIMLTVAPGGKVSVVGSIAVGAPDSQHAIASRLIAVLNPPPAPALAEDLREEGNVDVRYPNAAIGDPT